MELIFKNFIKKNVTNTTRLTFKRNIYYLSKLFPPIDLNPNDKFNSKVSSYVLMDKLNLMGDSCSGIYHYMPSLLRSYEKLVKLIDQQMKLIGAQKISLSCISPQRTWKASDRWDIMGAELFKLKDRNGSMFCLSPTHEEAVTSLVASQSPISYKMLPIQLYQIGRKFRDEMRPKHGLLRCKEFEMKDLYTFDSTYEKAEDTFNNVCLSYQNLLATFGLTFLEVEASTGLMGGKKSKEFHLISKLGEDIIYKCDKCGHNINKELMAEANLKDEKVKCQQQNCDGYLNEISGIEVAHAFLLGSKYSDTFNATFIQADKKIKPLIMGCYGIGISRLLAASLDINFDGKSLKWCPLIAPYQISIIPQKEGFKSDVTWELAENLISRIRSDVKDLSDEIILDDRIYLSIGNRINFATSYGFPYLIVLGKKALEIPVLYEVIDVYNNQTTYMDYSELLVFLSKIKTHI